MLASGVLPRSRSASPAPAQAKRPPGLGLSFDPYDHSVLPKRLVVLGSAANFPSVVNLLGDVFNAPVYAPLSDASVANAGPRARPAPAPSAGAGAGAGGGSSTPGGSLTPTHTAGGLLNPGGISGSSGATNTAITMSAAATQAAQAAHLPPGVVPAPSRASAALGSAYLACWAYRRKTRPDERFESFEDEIKSVLRTSAETARAERKAVATAAAGVFGAGAPGGGSHSGTTTPLARSGLGMPSPLLGRELDRDDTDTDTDEDDHVLLPQQQRTLSGDEGLKQSTPLASMGSFPSGSTLVTSSSIATTAAGGGLSGYSSNLSLNTAYASGGSPSSPGPITAAPQTAGGVSSSQPATLSVAPLPSDEADIDVGLVKVSECDIDSFMMYAALVPEYCRLEGMLVRALV